MKHRTCHLKLLLCAFLNTIEILGKGKKYVYLIHMFFILCFCKKVTYFWIRWSLT